MADAAQQSLIFGGVPVDPALRFEYDALYRLVAAEGRELAGADAQPAATDIARSAVPSATAARRYRETYAYDPGGNITSMRHEGGAGWERRYAYAADSNRLVRTSLPGDPPAGPFSATYAHDARGNLTAMPHLASLGWDAKDRLTTVDLGGGGTVHYTYDSAGRRVRKVIQRVGSIVEETVYVAGWERFRRRNGAGLVAERETLHVSDGGQRIAIVETDTRDAGGPIADPTPRVRYQLHNRLGSSTLEIDGSGAITSYEEYHPYGGTAYAAGAAKRYRFGGHERDDETGLYYCNARYYAPWLGRWISADPAGLGDGTNLYAYARGNPATYADPTGTESRDEELPSQAYDALKLIGVGSSNPSDGGGRSIWDRIASALGSLWDAVSSAASAAWNWLAGAAATAWDWIKGAASKAWNWIKGAAASAWSWIKGAASSAWEWTKGAASSAWSWIRGAASKAWTWVTGAASTAWNWTKRAVAAAWSWTKGAVSTAWTWIKGAAVTVGHALKVAAAWTWNWIIAPGIRVATNVLALGALGFLIGGPVGAVILGGVGLVTGAVHAWSMAYAGSYDWSKPTSWLMFLVDNTWSLPNSAVGALFSTLNIWNEIDTDPKRQGKGQLYYKTQWFSPFRHDLRQRDGRSRGAGPRIGPRLPGEAVRAAVLPARDRGLRGQHRPALLGLLSRLQEVPDQERRQLLRARGLRPPLDRGMGLRRRPDVRAELSFMAAERSRTGRGPRDPGGLDA